MGVLDDDQADTIRSSASKWLKASILCNEIEDEDIAAAAKLVEIPRPKLLMPDAIHIALCRRSNHALVTFDKDLLTIAVREGVTAIYPV